LVKMGAASLVHRHSLIFGCHAHGFAWACPLYAKRVRMATQSRGHGTQR